MTASRSRSVAVLQGLICGAFALAPSANAFAQGVDVGRSWSDCAFRPVIDRDNDSFDDNCEYLLAAAFRPHLLLSASDESPGRRSYWALRPTPPESEAPQEPVGVAIRRGAVRIFYALAYLRDSGARVGDRRLFAHDGDTEFIVVDVDWNSGGNWRLWRVFLSAHYLQWITDSSDWWYHGDLTYPAEDQGRPNIFVADNKHGNYPTRESCNALFDRCDADWPSDVLVSANRALGLRSGILLDEALADSAGATCTSDDCNHEWFWGLTADHRFCGWQVEDERHLPALRRDGALVRRLRERFVPGRSRPAPTAVPGGRGTARFGRCPRDRDRTR